MRNVSSKLGVVLACMLVPVLSEAACVTIDITSLTAAQRGKLVPAVVQIQADARVGWKAGPRLVGKQSAATDVEICAMDTTGITLAALQGRITTILNDQAAEDSAESTRASQLTTNRSQARSKLRALGLTDAEINALVDSAPGLGH